MLRFGIREIYDVEDRKFLIVTPLDLVYREHKIYIRTEILGIYGAPNYRNIRKAKTLETT